MLGDGNIQALLLIPPIFGAQCVGVVLQMTADENLTLIGSCTGEYTGLGRGSQQHQLHPIPNLPHIDHTIPGMRGIEHIVKAPEQGLGAI